MVLSILITFLLGKYRWYREKVVGYHVGELRKISWRWFVLPFYKRPLSFWLKRTLAHSNGGFPKCKQKLTNNIWKGSHFSLSWKFPWSCLFFLERRKTDYPEKTRGTRREQSKINPHIEAKSGYISQKQALSPRHQPCSPWRQITVSIWKPYVKSELINTIRAWDNENMESNPWLPEHQTGTLSTEPGRLVESEVI